MSNPVGDGFRRETELGLKQPHRALKYLEVRALFEAMSLLPSFPFLATQPRGDGRQIMLLPGMFADDNSMWPLRRYLDWLGYEALPWGLGRNIGRPEADAARVLERLQTLRRDGEPITLIGWSLGGVIAREVARREPGIVREVITMGTPVEGGPKYTAGGQRFAGSASVDLDELEQHIHTINSLGIEQPLTAIYSRSDGVVDWRAAIDRYNPQVRHHRVAGSHLGLGVNPWVWRIIARTLAGK